MFYEEIPQALTRGSHQQRGYYNENLHTLMRRSSNSTHGPHVDDNLVGILGMWDHSLSSCQARPQPAAKSLWEHDISTVPSYAGAYNIIEDATFMQHVQIQLMGAAIYLDAVSRCSSWMHHRVREMRCSIVMMGAAWYNTRCSTMIGVAW